MPTPDELKAKADDLRAQLAVAQAAVEASEGAVPEPTNEQEAMDQFHDAVVSHLGNHPKLEASLQKARGFRKSS